MAENMVIFACPSCLLTFDNDEEYQDHIQSLNHIEEESLIKCSPQHVPAFILYLPDASAFPDRDFPLDALTSVLREWPRSEASVQVGDCSNFEERLHLFHLARTAMLAERHVCSVILAPARVSRNPEIDITWSGSESTSLRDFLSQLVVFSPDVTSTQKSHPAELTATQQSPPADIILLMATLSQEKYPALARMQSLLPKHIKLSFPVQHFDNLNAQITWASTVVRVLLAKLTPKEVSLSPQTSYHAFTSGALYEQGSVPSSSQQEMVSTSTASPRLLPVVPSVRRLSEKLPLQDITSTIITPASVPMNVPASLME
eukprot:TRINITY_DN16981_c0_g1::TRINITY_DN16981_c0_g1_i1::g.13181::m.13181 TRINITY_DN16981_c0_g1::TRINITY_DN16981_c0_g1_i1::g.13181  ORF type:complete len:353 (-),score=-0.54,zf-C2H2_4/PF13894.1/0.064 TRINITY_DN16981_c0_g1_i1:34-981(-)